MDLSGYSFTFDLYGTLCDPVRAVDSASADPELARSWRKHQLEISWLLTIMDRYEDFDRVTAYGLDVALAETRTHLDATAKRELIERARAIPIYDDVRGSLRSLAGAGARLAVFSNGTPATVAAILDRAGISGYFQDVITTDELKTFKPAASVYRHAAGRIGRAVADVWHVSANPFDCAAAGFARMRVAKLERANSYRYPFALEPDVVIRSLAELGESVAARSPLPLETRRAAG